MDSREKQLERAVNRAATRLRNALNKHRPTAEITRLGDALTAAQNRLVTYKRNKPIL